MPKVKFTTKQKIQMTILGILGSIGIAIMFAQFIQNLIQWLRAY